MIMTNLSPVLEAADCPLMRASAPLAATLGIREQNVID